MTEETLKCPFCEQIMQPIDENEEIIEYNCVNESCAFRFIWHGREVIEKLSDTMYSIKQKSYSEGYEKGKEDGRKKAQKDLEFCRREHLKDIKFYEEKLTELENRVVQNVRM